MSDETSTTEAPEANTEAPVTEAPAAKPERKPRAKAPAADAAPETPATEPVLTTLSGAVQVNF